MHLLGPAELQVSTPTLNKQSLMMTAFIWIFHAAVASPVVPMGACSSFTSGKSTCSLCKKLTWKCRSKDASPRAPLIWSTSTRFQMLPWRRLTNSRSIRRRSCPSWPPNWTVRLSRLRWRTKRKQKRSTKMRSPEVMQRCLPSETQMRKSQPWRYDWEIYCHSKPWN